MDNDCFYCFHVGISDRIGIFFQQCVPPGADWRLDCNDYRLDVSGSLLHAQVSQWEMGAGDGKEK